MRRFLKALALIVGLAPFAAVLGVAVWARNMSVVLVAPNAFWIIAALFIIPIGLAFVLWRVANLLPR
jgi:hypothetical protein